MANQAHLDAARHHNEAANHHMTAASKPGAGNQDEAISIPRRRMPLLRRPM